MKDNGFDVYTISADGPEVAEVLKEGVEHFVVPFTRKITPLRDLQCLILLVSIIRKIKPDIIHTHTPKAGLLGMMAGRICGVPVRMHTVAGLPLMVTSGLKRTLLEMTERFTYASAHKVLPNSKGLETFMVKELNISQNKIRLIGKGSSNGIDTSYFKSTQELRTKAEITRQQYGIKPNDLVFCFIGRIVKDKGIIELVSAFKRVADEIKNDPGSRGNARKLFLMMIGPFEEELDPLPPDVMRFLREDIRVILAGFQDDVRPGLIASDIFVFPSYREGFPNVVMQASLLEVPSIVSDINGCNEIIEHNVTGLIVPPKDERKLADAMLKLAINPDLRRSLAGAAHRYVSMHYDRMAIWEAIRKEYESLTRKPI